MKFFLFSLSAVCAFTEPMFRDSVGFNGFIISLKQKGCHLTYSRHESNGNIGKSISGAFLFSPNTPCYFLRKHGEVQHFAFADLKVDGVFIVVSSPLTRTEKLQKKLPKSDFCGRRVFGVVVKGKQVDVVSDYITGIWCRNDGADESLFKNIAQKSINKKWKKG